MSISKSYNKQMGVHYAYETTYEWNEELQKKVQRRRCVGQFDPETGEVIPNKKVGRPSVEAKPKTSKKPTDANKTASINTKSLANRLKKTESKISLLAGELTALSNELASIRAELGR